MLHSVSLLRLSIGMLSSFVALTWLSIYWIPFDYPTENWLIILGWQIRDQLFRIRHYIYLFSIISFFCGLIFSLKLTGVYHNVQRYILNATLGIWLLWVTYEQLQRAPGLDNALLLLIYLLLGYRVIRPKVLGIKDAI